MPAALKWLIALIVDRVLKFLYEKIVSWKKTEEAKKESAEEIKQDQAAKAEKLKQAQTKDEVENAAKDSISGL